MRALGGPLLGRVPIASISGEPGVATDWGLDPLRFGKHPEGRAIDPASLCVRAPAVVTFRLPGEFAEGAELVATGVLDESTGAEGSVQFGVVAGTVPGPKTSSAWPIVATTASTACRLTLPSRPLGVPTEMKETSVS